MGNAFSSVRHAFSEVSSNVRVFKELRQRTRTEPGLPVDNPSRSFWMYPPSPIAKYCSDLPQHADVIIIGSGITGTSVARSLLDQVRAEGKQLPVVLMLEARDACSGATGRNGGHLDPRPYDDFTTAQERGGSDSAADKYAKFRHSHVPELKRVAEEEGIFEQSQWRQVDAIEVYFQEDMFEEAKEGVEAYNQAVPSEASFHRVYESSEAIQKYSLAEDVVGCISCDGAAIHPYRFVTGVLSNLLKRYSNNFLLCTNTPCTSITGPSKSDPLYTIVTPKGNIKTPHVIHATNAWSSHLLQPMRGKIIPYRAYMTAQRPGQSLPAETIQRSFIFLGISTSYDYLTQLPNGDRELMFGGGFLQDGDGGDEAFGNTDDSTYNKVISSYLAGVLPRFFGEENWGPDGRPPQGDAADLEGVQWSKGRVKASWSGIAGLSADDIPWVGRLPRSISGRPAPPNPQGTITTPPGEWIAAGYSGEGMVQAWLCGKALAEMVLGREDEGKLAEWFPDTLRVTTQRWKKADWVAMLSEED